MARIFQSSPVLFSAPFSAPRPLFRFRPLFRSRFFSANFKLHEVPDHPTRHSFAKTGAELLDVVPAKKNLHGIVDPEVLLDECEKHVVYAPWGDSADDR